MTIRRARAGDADSVGALLSDFNAEFDSPSPTADELAARFGPLLTRDDVLVHLAVRDRDHVGFALTTLRPTPYFDGPLAQLEELYVRPALRSHGIGTELMSALDEELRARGCGELHIGVDEVDTDTRRFYERLGFVNVEPGADHRMLLYLRELG